MLATVLLLGAATAQGAPPIGLDSPHPRVVLQHRPDGAPFEG